MSSKPGNDLEDLLAWNFDLTVEDQEDPNWSLRIAEMLGRIKSRRHLTKSQFAPIVAIYEPVRDQIEDKLLDYSEEENGSWRDYYCYAFDHLMTDERHEQATQYLKDLTW